MVPFRDRAHAGQFLAEKLADYASDPDTLVLALPRGGVPVAYEVARSLQAPLDVYVVRKLGVPWRRELAMGAIASGGVRVLNPDVIQVLGISEREIEMIAADEQQELTRREAAYRGDRPPVEVQGRTVILVDDGLATGSTMRAAVAAVRRQDPKKVVIAVPIGSPDVCAELRTEADDVVCAVTVEPFHAVGLWYADFSETPDEDIHTLLERAAAWPLRHAA